MTTEELASHDAYLPTCDAVVTEVTDLGLVLDRTVAYARGGHSVYRTVLPFHTRSELQWSTSLGWYIGLAPLEVATAEARDFEELIQMVRHGSRIAKPVAQVPFAKVCTLLDTVLRPLSMLSYIDARMVPGAAFFGSVAPMISRFVAMASSPSSTCTTTRCAGCCRA